MRLTDAAEGSRSDGGLKAFLATEVGGTFVLIAAAVAGLAWANSPWRESYQALWHTELAIRLGPYGLAMDLKEWVNDGLMTLFFFVVGLEVSREVRIGQLREPRLVTVPICAAIAGMAFPALIYFAINAGGQGAPGWGVPMATDTAFVVGLLALVGARCAEPLRAYLLTLAVVDDIGAMMVVALFYTDDLSLPGLFTAIVLFGLIVAARWLRLWRTPAYLILGVALWVATLESGVHPTLVGIALGALVAVYAPSDHKILQAGEKVHTFARAPTPEGALRASRSVREAVSVNERLQLLLHPWTSYVIVPLFAFANAGVSIDPQTLSAVANSPITIGCVAGLVIGKLAGISFGTWLPLRLGLGDLPGNLVWGQVLGGAAVCGIGFTVSLFIADLAFGDPVLQDQAKIGIFCGSLIAAALSWLIFHLAWDRGSVCAPPARDEDPEPYTGPLTDPVDDRNDHIRGPVDAPVTLVEYGDFECPYCGRLHTILTDLRRQYGDRLRVVFRHFPLYEIHPHARPAAVTAEAASAVGKFWEMHDLLFENQRNLTDGDLASYARRLDVVPPFGYRHGHRRVKIDIESGRRSGVRGTPTLFINDDRYQGPLDAASLSNAIEAAL